MKENLHSVVGPGICKTRTYKALGYVFVSRVCPLCWNMVEWKGNYLENLLFCSLSEAPGTLLKSSLAG